MLRPALEYENALRNKVINKIWFDERYKYFNRGWEELFELKETTWEYHQFVSINKQGKVCGFLSYRVDRATRNIDSFNAVSFFEDKLTFAQDIALAIHEIFTKFYFHKLIYGVVCGNPVEKTYQKFADKCNGRLAAVYRDDALLYNGQRADVKVFEIMRSEYLASKQNSLMNRRKGKWVQQ